MLDQMAMAILVGVYFGCMLAMLWTCVRCLWERCDMDIAFGSGVAFLVLAAIALFVVNHAVYG